MTLRHLKIFITVYECLSFTKAGALLHLAQPSVSLAIRELEENYQKPLFDRIKHKIYPTEYGEQLYHYAVHILSLCDEMEHSIKDWNLKQLIKVGSSVTIGNKILPDLILAFQSIHPDIEVEVMIHNSITIETYIMQNQIDFALIENEPTIDKITSIPFMSDSLCTIAHPAHPLADKKNISLQDLNAHHFLVREHGSSVRELVESVFLMNQVVLRPFWVSASTSALIQAVKHNLGITTLPYQLVKQEIEKQQVTMLHVPKLKINRHYNVIYHRDKYISKAVQDFVSLCQQYGKSAS